MLYEGDNFVNSKMDNSHSSLKLLTKLLEFKYVNAEQGSIFKGKKNFLKLKEPCLEKHRPSTKCPPQPYF